MAQAKYWICYSLNTGVNEVMQPFAVTIRAKSDSEAIERFIAWRKLHPKGCDNLPYAETPQLMKSEVLFEG